MTDYWKTRLAQFRQSPIEEISGVLKEGIWGSSFFEKPDLLLSPISFVAWRMGGGDLQFTPLSVVILAPNDELIKLRAHIRTNAIVRIKAHVIDNEAGDKQALYVDWLGLVHDDSEFNEIQQERIKPLFLDLPPMLRLRHNGQENWNGTVVLKSWSGFSAASDTAPKPLSGLFPLSIDTEKMPLIRRDYKGVPPTPAQMAAYVYLVENEEAVRDAILQAILGQYPQWQSDYGVDPERMPNVSHLKQFESLLRLVSVGIGHESKQGVAYTSFALTPEWDIEHGMGAILHKERVVAIGRYESLEDAIEQDVNNPPTPDTL